MSSGYLFPENARKFVALYGSGLSVAWIYDKYLDAGVVLEGLDGIWHIGEGTDLGLLAYRMNLTAWDRRFLRSMKIDPEPRA